MWMRTVGLSELRLMLLLVSGDALDGCESDVDAPRGDDASTIRPMYHTRHHFSHTNCSDVFMMRVKAQCRAL